MAPAAAARTCGDRPGQSTTTTPETTMTEPLDLAPIEARATAATPGPWERHPAYGPTFFANATGSFFQGVGDLNFGVGEQAEADEEFVRYAQPDVTALIAEVNRLRAAAPSAPAAQPSIRDTMGPADGQQKMRLLGRLYASTAPVEEPADTDLRDRIAAAVWARYPDAKPSRTGLVMANPHALADAVLSALPAPADRADEAPLTPYYEHPACGFHWHGRDGMDIPMRDGQPVCPRCELHTVRAAVLRAASDLPAWEAVYEPGNVSDYLIGYANTEAAAKGAAEAWMRSQKDQVGRIEWVPDEQLATGRYDEWFEIVEHHDDGVPTGPGIIVRRMADEAQQAEHTREPQP